MGVGMLLMVSILSAFEILYIIYSWDKHWLEAALGYKIWLDIIFSLGTTIYFALSGTISGVIIATFSGFIFSMTLLAASKLIGYRKRQLLHGKKVWIYYPPEWNIKTMLNDWKTKSLLTLKGVMK